MGVDDEEGPVEDEIEKKSDSNSIVDQDHYD